MSENMDQGAVQSEQQTPADITQVEQTPVERVAGQAYERTSEAADSLRRGELMQNSEVDPLADSDDRLIALLSYVLQIFPLIGVVMPVIVLLSESSKKRPFQRYHAVQSLALVLFFWALFMLVTIGTTIVQIIPILGQIIGFFVACLTPITWFVTVLLFLYYGFQAYKGRRFAIPGLTAFLNDQGWL